MKWPFKMHLVCNGYQLQGLIWATSSEFVSSSIPSWQISTGHAQPFRGARDLVFCLKDPLDSLLVWASSEGSGETARMRRLAWTFAARIGDKYQIRLTWSICHCGHNGTIYCLVLLYSKYGKRFPHSSSVKIQTDEYDFEALLRGLGSKATTKAFISERLKEQRYWHFKRTDERNIGGSGNNDN